nr:glycosyltransferase family 4 protein [Caulobacter sp. 17J80-11]
MDAVAPLVIERTADAGLARKLVRRWLKAGRVSDAARFVDLTEDPHTRRELGRRDLAEQAAAHVGRRARRFSQRAPGVLYLLHNSLPFHSGGYAARAHGLLQGFRRAGWETFAVARPGYPSDRADGAEPPQAAYDIDGVTYRFLRQDVSVEQADQPGYVEAYAEAVLDAVPHERIGVVQAASFYYNAFAGRIVADRLGVPLVYEMRGLEWFTRGSQEPRWLDSEQAATMRELELRAAHAADLVFAITGALRDWLVENGVPARKLALLPNGCTADRFKPREKNTALARTLGFSRSFVVGYIGSVVFYEGVELIVEAVRRAREASGQDIRFLLVGDGAGMASVQRAIAAHGGERFVVATGRVPHDQVEDYYSVIDAMVLARTDLPVCQVISPLKPVEAMAMGKPLITSDVAAIKEMIDASGGGLLYPAGDAEALAGRILEMAASEPLRRELSARGRAWAIEARDWDALAADALADIRARLFKDAE